MNGEWYQKNSTEVVEQLGSDLHKGLPDSEAARRLEKNGPNELKGKPRATMLERLLAQFKDFLVLILVAASVVSAFVGEVTDSLVIVAIVILNAALGVFQESKAEKAMEALQKMAAPNSKVLRDGTIQVVPSRELVVGDIVLLEAGDYIPADVRILESMNLKVEEASLTGESVPVEKETVAMDHEASLADRHNMGYMGTVVTYGRGRAVIIGTGMDTEIGKIGRALQQVKSEETALQKETNLLVRNLALLGLGLCLLVVVAYGITRGNWLQGVLAGITTAMAVLPEEFPVVLTVFLALGAWRISQNNVLTRRVPAVETLGSATVLCTDKTGTLTLNRMKVKKIFASGQSVELDDG